VCSLISDLKNALFLAGVGSVIFWDSRIRIRNFFTDPDLDPFLPSTSKKIKIVLRLIINDLLSLKTDGNVPSRK
jgi:hypothetical protein